MATTKPTSSSGFYVVTLKKTFEHAGFFYKPGMSNIIVNEVILDAMIAGDAVDTVSAQ
jgi:hypothetical protein